MGTALDDPALGIGRRQHLVGLPDRGGGVLSMLMTRGRVAP
jgi:hypothetical protein